MGKSFEKSFDNSAKILKIIMIISFCIVCAACALYFIAGIMAIGDMEGMDYLMLLYPWLVVLLDYIATAWIVCMLDAFEDIKTIKEYLLHKQ